MVVQESSQLKEKLAALERELSEATAAASAAANHQRVFVEQLQQAQAAAQAAEARSALLSDELAAAQAWAESAHSQLAGAIKAKQDEMEVLEQRLAELKVAADAAAQDSTAAMTALKAEAQ